MIFANSLLLTSLTVYDMHRIMNLFVNEDRRIFDGATYFIDAQDPELELPGTHRAKLCFIAIVYL
jgi:hypothetical protein